MSQTTKTFLTAEQGQEIARAIRWITEAVDKVNSVHSSSVHSAVRWRMEAVRDLAAQLSGPVPEPTCDAPKCDCGTRPHCETPEICAAYRLEPKPTRRVEDVPTAKVTGSTITIRKGHWGRAFDIAKLWDLPDVSEPFGPVIEFSSKLDGLIAKVDALAERLPHTDAHTVRVVSPTGIDRDCDRDTETWLLDPKYQGHAAPFAMGDAVTDSSAYHGLFQVLSVGQRYGDKKIELRLKRHPGFVFDTEAF